MGNPAWLEINVTVDCETAEAVSEVLSRYIDNGVVIERGVDFLNADDAGTPAGPCRVFAYLPVDDPLEEKKQRISEGLWYLGRIASVPEPEFRFIENEDWMASWKQFYKPILIGKKLLILPAWIESNEPDRTAIKIDPSMAFGTGTHPTTQLCLEMAEDYIQPGQDVIDVGCGSGILSIGALLLGASHALGIDIDEESMQSSRENGQHNGVIDRMELTRQPVSEVLKGAASIQQAPLVMANILTHILISLFDQGMAELIQPGGTILLSGILEEQDGRIREAAAAKGLEFLEKRQIADWVAYAFRRPAA